MSEPVDNFLGQIDYLVRKQFSDTDSVPDEKEVENLYGQYYDALSILPNFKDICATVNRSNAIDSLVKQYCTDLSVTKRVGFAYKDEECKPWLNSAEDEIENRNGWFYWNRYKNYLLYDKKWARAAVRSIEKDTWEILNLMANPLNQNDFERRGLVVASVQSGKTANYIGLISRAADAGYKIIIVMAGVYNVLRNQTQARLDEGFTGFKIIGTSMDPTGVGKLNKFTHRPIACTSRDSDFNKKHATALKGIQTANTNEPWLFVIKKNSNSLKQVYEWLRDNANPTDQVLIIDDEADNASINVKYRQDKPEEDPTRINGQIRTILNFFSRKCYVGYTATPFANILIDPNVDTDAHGKDLFPSSFIYTLEESSNYFGADKVFDDIDEASPKYIRFIDDIDSILPPKHKSDFQVQSIPESLKYAIRTFVIATSIRAIRGDANEHSSMMVNVSPWKATQSSVEWLTRDYLRQLRDSIKAYSALPGSEALKLSSDLRLLKDTWRTEYSSLAGISWDQIQQQLYDTIKTMRIVSINSDSNDSLEYEIHTEHVIAIGGYRLSRGLTLEGLVVSYYSRNAKAYDALMQMARWFGYRPGYEDLCRIWMSDKSAGWYKFVADTTSDLFDELRNMRHVNGTPRNYGLRIRQSPDSLIVTARNKMGTGQTLEAPFDIVLNNSFVETIALDRDSSIIDRNRAAVANLLKQALILSEQDDSDTLLYHGIPVSLIVEFLSAYVNDDTGSPKSQTKPILDYIDDRLQDGELSEWDVYVASGDGKQVTLADGLACNQEIRYPGSATSKDRLVIGEKQRLSSRGIERFGLSKEQQERAKANFHLKRPDKTNVSDAYYRELRSRPLLVIHPICVQYSDRQRKLSPNGDTEIIRAGIWESWQHHEDAFGWSISFPKSDKQTPPVQYVFNQVAIENLNAETEEVFGDDREDA